MDYVSGYVYAVYNDGEIVNTESTFELEYLSRGNIYFSEYISDPSKLKSMYSFIDVVDSTLHNAVYYKQYHYSPKYYIKFDFGLFVITPGEAYLYKEYMKTTDNPTPIKTFAGIIFHGEDLNEISFGEMMLQLLLGKQFTANDYQTMNQLYNELDEQYKYIYYTAFICLIKEIGFRDVWFDINIVKSMFDNSFDINPQSYMVKLLVSKIDEVKATPDGPGNQDKLYWMQTTLDDVRQLLGNLKGGRRIRYKFKIVDRHSPSYQFQIR